MLVLMLTAPTVPYEIWSFGWETEVMAADVEGLSGGGDQ